MSDRIYDANNIANYILRFHVANGFPISNLKLQKELYFLQVEFVTQHGKPLFHNPIEAWGCGPVVPDVYKKYSMFSSGTIPVVHLEKFPWNICNSDLEIIDIMLIELEKYSSVLLTQITVNQAPWKNARARGCEISPMALKVYFSDESEKKVDDKDLKVLEEKNTKKLKRCKESDDFKH